jgi:hypothetical protein
VRGKVSLKKGYLSKDMTRGGKEGAMQVPKGREFQAEATAACWVSVMNVKEVSMSGGKE